MKTTLRLNVEVEFEYKFDEASHAIRIEWLRVMGELMGVHKLEIPQMLDFERQILVEIEAKKSAEQIADSVG